MASTLQARPLNVTPGSFNWIYLVEYIVCGILSIFFLFYFNRLFATAVSYAIRLYSWHVYRVYIDIGALQISLLAGRLFFKDIRYHGDNETIFVHAGYITWRYWLRSVKTCQRFEVNHSKTKKGTGRLDGDSAETAGKKRTMELPCRISVNVSGVEAFLYNRGPAYDFILENLGKHDAEQRAAAPQTEANNAAEKTGSVSSDPTAPPGLPTNDIGREKTEDTMISSSTSSPSDLFNDTATKRPTPPIFLRMLPVHVEAHTIAAVLGNKNTKSIITAKIVSATGEFDAANSGPLDIFKFVIDFDVENPVFKMLPNVDFKDPQLLEAAKVKSMPPADTNTKKTSRATRFSNWGKRDFFSITSKLRRSLDSIAPHLDGREANTARKRLDIPGSGKWQGLSRYLDGSKQSEHGEWDPVEYAKTSTLADLSSVHFRFYWDIPGKVPSQQSAATAPVRKGECRINGSKPPEYGMEIRVRGGHVNYGPWADRHRLALQQAFFPATYTNATPFLRLKAGQDRLCTVFDILVSVDEDTVLRIPFREPSKDWRWRGRSAAYDLDQSNSTLPKQEKSKGRKKSDKQRKRDKGIAGADLRPFAWFDIVIKANSTIAYVMDMFPHPDGYQNDLRVDVSGLEIFSSLNHALLWKSNRVALNCDLSYPLAWRAVRNWVFNIDISDLEFFLLRDHTFLLMDLIEDWTRGPRPEFYTFVPFRYLLNTKFHNFKLFLNVNDGNIINYSDDIEENDFVILFGRHLDSQLTIPLDRLNPPQSDIIFDVTAMDLGFELRMPPKNTLSDLLLKKTLATLPSVIVKGIYNMCSEQSPSVSDTLNLNIVGDGLNIEFYGFFARQLVKVKENYFGEDIHFRTFEEYQATHEKKIDEVGDGRPSTAANDLDVILNIVAHDGTIVVPAGMYDSQENLLLQFHTADVDLRVNNYYLELMVNSYPLEMGCSYRHGENLEEISRSDGQLSIDGISVYGHRLFGQPPTEPAYVSNWDIDAGEILAECSESFVAKAVAAAQSFVMSIGDQENAMPVPILPALHDIIYVRFCCPLLSLWTHTDDDAFVLAIRAIQGSFNDCASEHFSQRLQMQVPEVTLACVDRAAAHQHRERKSTLPQPHAYLQTALTMTMVQRDPSFDESKQKQKDFVASQDERSGRATFLSSQGKSNQRGGREAMMPSINVPGLPPPIAYEAPATRATRAELKSDQSTGQAFGEDLDSLGDSNVYHPRRYLDASSRKPSIQNPTLGLSSIFKKHDSSLHSLKLDLSGIPELRKDLVTSKNRLDTRSVSSDILFNPKITDDATHTSLLFMVDPGISAYARPRAVHALGRLIDSVLPKHPAQVFDDFAFQTLSEVLSSYGKSHGKNSILDVGVQLPQVCMRFVNNIQENQHADSDQWDLSIVDADIFIRQKVLPERNDEADSTSVHATVSAVKVAAQPTSNDGTQDGKSFEASVDDVLIWLMDGERTSVHTSFRTIEAVVESKKMDHLAHLIHQTTVLADNLQSQFNAVVDRRTWRRRNLVYLLLKYGRGIGDPTFLNRPAYASRHSAEQLRNSDSWKIMSRLRHIMLRLSNDQRRLLMHDFFTAEQSCPRDAENYVVATLDTWRSWEAIRVRDSFAVRIIFGSLGGIEKLHDRSKIPLEIHAHAKGIKIAIDPGQKENAFSLDGLSLGLIVEPPPLEAAMQIFHEHGGCKSTTLQIHTNGVALSINWSLFDLVDRLLALFKKSDFHFDQTQTQATFDGSKEDPEIFHIVVASTAGTISIETIHLIHTFEGDGLKLSAIASTSSDGSDDHLDLNVMTCAHALSLGVRTSLEDVSYSEALQPKLWVCFERSSSPKTSKERLRLVGDSTGVLFTVKEDILGILEIANSVITDEIHQVQDLISKYTLASTDRHEASHKSTVEHSLSTSVALSLKTYGIDFTLTPGLRYSIKGKLIRLSVVPDPKIFAGFNANLDLSTQEHNLWVTSKGNSFQLVSIIHAPPINGGLQLVFAEDVNTVAMTVSMDALVLDGSALFGLLGAVLNEQTSSAIDAIASDVATVTETVARSFPKKENPLVVKSTSAKGKKDTIFDANIALAGFSISSNAPVKSDPKSRAKLVIFSGPIRAKISNEPPGNGAPLVFPEFHISMGQAGLRLIKNTSRQDQHIGVAKIAAAFSCTMKSDGLSHTQRNFQVSLLGPDVEIFAETSPTVAEIVCHLQGRIQELDIHADKHHLRRLRHIVPGKQKADERAVEMHQELPYSADAQILSTFAFDLEQASIRYIMDEQSDSSATQRTSDLVFSIQSLNLHAKSSKEARMRIVALQVHLGPKSEERTQRPLNSATLPEMIFSVVNESTKSDRRLYFRATGKALEVLLDSHFIIPLTSLENSLSKTVERTKEALASFKFARVSTGLPSKNVFGAKKLSTLVMDLTFAGAVIRLQSRGSIQKSHSSPGLKTSDTVAGRYGQFSGADGPAQATLRAPGMGAKAEFIDNLQDAASLNVEIRVDGSNNTFSPAVVPVIMELAQSIKHVVRIADDEKAKSKGEQKPVQKLIDDEAIVQADPRAILGKTKLNIGLRICKQSFSLSCHPIAKVAASASIEDIYLTVNTVDSQKHGHFFAGTAAFHGLKLTLKHDYSMKPTFGFDMKSIMLSVMNSKHLSGSPGISAILRVNPTKTHINAKSLQDILLFREIWLPAEIRNATKVVSTHEEQDSNNEYFVHRYHQLAAAKTFRWNATFAIADLSIDLDLGQSIGNVRFGITNLWASSKKSTSAQQSLCVGIDNVFMHSTGRMSGFVELRQVNARTSIAWPSDTTAFQTPMIQGAVSFDEIRIKASFDYQVFAIAHITSFEFIMYNVRDEKKVTGDRLVAILDGDKVNVYCISASAALCYSLFQAFEKLVTEQETLYAQSLQDVEKYLRRGSTQPGLLQEPARAHYRPPTDEPPRKELKLHTDVVVSLRSIDIGAFPTTLFDKQLLRLTASETQARFAVVNDSDKIRSGLGLELGKVNAALSSVSNPIVPKALGDINIEEVVRAATTSNRGVILAVPRVLASMQTWQSESNAVEYIFRSTFEGKIDVGWNYARISFMRGMWATHTKALTARLGKKLPESALQIHGGPKEPTDSTGDGPTSREDQKLTAVVNLPQSSKYTYVALEPAIIDTPQLRDMGDATPPLEWVGLNREKLPNVTHQIIIVPLLELAREVEDAYTRILGSA